MTDKLDNALMELVEMTIEEIKMAKQANFWSKEFVEGVSIVLSMAYGRFGGETIGNQPTYSSTIHNR